MRRRRPGILMAAALVAIVFAAGLTWWLYRRTVQPRFSATYNFGETQVGVTLLAEDGQGSHRLADVLLPGIPPHVYGAIGGNGGVRSDEMIHADHYSPVFPASADTSMGPGAWSFRIGDHVLTCGPGRVKVDGVIYPATIISPATIDVRPRVNASDPYTPLPGWHKGRQFDYSVAKSQMRSGGPNPILETLQYTLSLRVVDVDARQVQLEASVTNTKLVFPKDPTGEAARVAAGFGKDVVLRYHASVSGEVGQVDNLDEIRAGAVGNYDLAIAVNPESERKKLHDQFLSIAASPAFAPVLESAALVDPRIVQGCLGIQFQPHAAPVRVTVPLPMAPGAVIPATRTCEILQQDPTTVSIRRSLVSDVMGAEIIDKIMHGIGADGPTAATLPAGTTMQLSETTDVLFYRAVGMPESIHYKRSVSTAGIKEDLEMQFKLFHVEDGAGVSR